MRRRAFPQGGPLLMPKHLLNEWIDLGGEEYRCPFAVERWDVARTLREGPITAKRLRNWDSDRDTIIDLLTARHRNPESVADAARVQRGIDWCEKWLKWDAIREHTLLVNSSIELFDARYRFRERSWVHAQFDRSYADSCSDPSVTPAPLLHEVIDPWCWRCCYSMGPKYSLGLYFVTKDMGVVRVINLKLRESQYFPAVCSFGML